MDATPVVRIQQAFLHLEFALKLMCLFERREISKDSFDRQTTFKLLEGDLSYVAAGFHTYEDLIYAAQNVYSTALGVTAVAFEKAFEDAGVRNDPTDNSARGQLRSLLYQVRCAFAHDLMNPRWEVRGQYLRAYDLQLCGASRSIDLRHLHRQSLELEHIGGILTYMNMKDEVIAWLGSIADPLG